MTVGNDSVVEVRRSGPPSMDPSFPSTLAPPARRRLLPVARKVVRDDAPALPRPSAHATIVGKKAEVRARVLRSGGGSVVLEPVRPGRKISGRVSVEWADPLGLARA